MSTGTLQSTPRAREVARSVGQLPAMPHVAARVLELLESETSTALQLKATIETDPALTAAVLRLVNSAMFGLPERIGTLSHAVALLGYSRLRSLTVAAVVAGLKDLAPAEAANSRDEIWEHSVDTALGARLLADDHKPEWSEEAFVAGLLHDCGRLVLLGVASDRYVPLFANGARPGLATERSELGFDHQEVGGALLDAWGFPAMLRRAAEEHHENAWTDDHAGIVGALVALADRLIGHGDAGDPMPAARHLGLDVGELDSIALDLDGRVRSMRQELLSL